MEARRDQALQILFICLCLCMSVSTLQAQLQVGFYDTLCPAAEIIVQDEVKKAAGGNPGIAAGLLRLLFHDSFVRGCDASVLIDSTPNNMAEKDANPNKSLRGFEVIDSIKSRLEEACFGIVSCADILAFAARDSVVLTGGQSYQVPAGRRDGNVSSAQEANANLPSPSSDVNQLTQSFASKGLTQAEMVALSGAHTIGASHCSSFSNRLYSFSPTTNQDPTLNPSYLSQLMQQCPQGNTNDGSLVPMDPITPNAFDTNYYADVVANRGLFTSDQTLLSAQSTAGQVIQYANNADIFMSDFTAAILKMGAIGVLTGSDGQIRADCRVVNS